MYKVVLIEKGTDNEVGDLGEYATFEQAQREVVSYNRKADRHRGFATIQAAINDSHDENEDMFSDLDSESDFEDDFSEEELFSEPQRPQKPLGGLKLKISNPSPRQQHFEQPPQRQRRVPSNLSPINDRHEELNEIYRSPINNPNQSRRYESYPSQVSGDYVLLKDTKHNRHIVMKNDKTINLLQMSNPLRYELLEMGDFSDMVSKRNYLNKGQ